MNDKIDITLKNLGQSHLIASGQSLLDLAKQYGRSPHIIGAHLNGVLCDLHTTIESDSDIEWITTDNPLAADIIRHSCAHLLAHAVKELFPSAQVTIGPVIEYGFYYDFSYAEAFSPVDLEQITLKMKSLAKQKIPISKAVWQRDAAQDYFSQQGEFYKVEILQAIPESEPITVYQQGTFVDLCRGPHVPHTGFLQAFQLTNIAGAYWRGDHHNEMLQRIYGVAFATKPELTAHLAFLQEMEKRDHRQLAKQMNLFHLQKEAPGMVFWHPAGYRIWLQIEHYLRNYLRQSGYLEVRTPQVLERSLWEASGHIAKFHEHMFTTQVDETEYLLKPMSCPAHVQLFNQGIRSYRELPLRLAEFGCCHRYELTGALHGLMRVRQMVQDDGHIFCTVDQIADEAHAFIQQVLTVYRHFGFHEVGLALSTRPEQRVGDDHIWDLAEQHLQQALQHAGHSWSLQAGEGAFYGPKIEFSLKDRLGRTWQCGTLQLDFNLPERLNAHYIAEDGKKHHPVMLHRAILGTLERFIGICLEHHAGLLPLWMSPMACVVLPISDKHLDYAEQVTEKLKTLPTTVELDARPLKINLKIRSHTLAKVPYLIIIGEQEIASETISIRTHSGQQWQQFNLNEWIAICNQAILLKQPLATVDPRQTIKPG